MRLSTLTFLAALAASTIASPTPFSHVLHEKRGTVASRGWSKRSKLGAKVQLPMRIGLAQNNLHLGPTLLHEVSAHDSPKYGKHYTADEVIELFAPAPNTVDAVRDWLHMAGIEANRITLSANKVS